MTDFENHDLVYNNTFINENKIALNNDMEKRKQEINSILKIPILFTYQVNVLYYSNEYDYLDYNNLFEEIDNNSINPLFYSFISQLGNVYVNNQGEIELCYKDAFYNIKFN